MKNWLIFVITFVVLTGCGGSGSSSSSSDDTDTFVLRDVPDYQLEDTQALLSRLSTRLEGLAFDDFLDVAFSITVERNPEGIIADSGIAALGQLELSLNNISDPHYLQSIEVQKLLLQQLLSFNRDALSDSQRLSFDIYQSHLSLEIEEADYRQFEYPATYGGFGWPGVTERFFTELAPLTQQTDAQAYLDLLNQIGRRFEQLAALLDARQASGVIEPAITLGFSLNRIEEVAATAPANTSYYLAFDEKITPLSTISDSQKQQLRTQLLQIIEQRVLPAYGDLARHMASLLNGAPSAIGFSQFEGGREFYDFALRYYTSGNLSVDQVHQLGLDELDRIHAQMRVLFDQLGYPQEESLAASYARVDQQAGLIAGNEAVGVYESIIEQAYAQLPASFSVLPQQELVVIGGDTGGFYIGGSDDGSRPGAFYAYTASDLPYTNMPTLAYHEGVPGHHLQIALAKELDLPQFRREANFTAYVEGWALYAERLAKELGWYLGDIYGDLGRLQYEAMRAARLVLDTGIHAKGWSYQQAELFSLENVGNRGSIARYSVLPGQATAYMIGMLTILELRQKAEEQLGDSYDIRDFHGVIIGNGSMPMHILTEQVDHYIASKLTE